MYHSISATEEPGVSDYFRVCTSPARFAEHMAQLQSSGWEGVSLAEALRRLKMGSGSTGTRPAKPVAITFDDGFRDFYTEAWPILQRHGFSATMYLPTHYISESRQRFKERECLTWTEVRELHRAGIEFGSHTVHHPTLVELAPDEVRKELAESKATMERELGVPIDAFAYPYAFPQNDRAFVAAFRAMLNELGYTTCVTTLLGRVTPSSDRLLLPRLPANSADDVALLAAKVTGAYDWVAMPQRFRKALGRARRSAPRPVPDFVERSPK
jgi:peptidoglycan/xylan/chitin deacetylase (PgdA/CDA1 family)